VFTPKQKMRDVAGKVGLSINCDTATKANGGVDKGQEDYLLR
jgi:hypothetical protein